MSLEAAGLPKGWVAGVRKGRRLWAVGWRRGRLVLVHGSENQKQEGRLCFFLFKGRERPEEEDGEELGTVVGGCERRRRWGNGRRLFFLFF